MPFHAALPNFPTLQISAWRTTTEKPMVRQKSAIRRTWVFPNNLSRRLGVQSTFLGWGDHLSQEDTKVGITISEAGLRQPLLLIQR